MDTNIGKLIKDRYLILEKISIGGSSYVYLVKDQILNRKSVLKILFKNLFNSKSEEKIFKNEIKIISQLKHKNIATLYDYFKFNDFWCLVLEFVDGITFREYLEKYKTISEEKLVQLFIQILEVLNYTESKKIVHHDIKPENIMITKKNKIKILDFGISIDNFFNFNFENITTIGTIKYIAPEIIANQKITVKSDIYSIGLILYESLVGQHPFFGTKPNEFIQKHLYEKTFRVRKFNKSVSCLMENIVIKAIAKNPSERYDSSEEMIKDLKNVLDPISRNCSLLVLKNEIYIGIFNNKIFVKNFIKEKKYFWLNKKFLYLFILFKLLIFIIFVFLVLWKTN